ncbi:hypothetical protein LIER_37246 [Lithospermum erythrorhizon]|uniref:Aminotransferase-like plant mobile domain-containing protein n=1 Tax=Lithospermum erythrorhizon TaxID=34254 RepID=A0AAV3PIY4_LITER
MDWLLVPFVSSYIGYEAVDRSTSKMASLNGCPRRLYVVEHRPWDSADRHPFDVLRVGIDMEEEVYCAAFLSCWLCVFVLPTKPLDLIRAIVFKMASFMANGSRVSLAPPVLACIYRGLSQITLSNNPSVAPECFPAHYLFGWMRARRTITFPGNATPNSPLSAIHIIREIDSSIPDQTQLERVPKCPVGVKVVETRSLKRKRKSCGRSGRSMGTP